MVRVTTKGSARGGTDNKRQAVKDNDKDLTNEDEAYDAIMGGDFGSLDIGTYTGSKNDGPTQHLPDAVDFEDEDELADEELPVEEDAVIGNENIENVGMNPNLQAHYVGIHDEMREAYFDGPVGEDFMEFFPQDGNSMMPRSITPNQYQSGNNSLFLEMDDANVQYMEPSQSETFMHNATQKQQEVAGKLKAAELLAKQEKQLLKAHFPEFSKGKILKWNRLLYKKMKNYQYQSNQYGLAKSLTPLIPLSLKFQVQPDQRRWFNNTENIWQSSMSSTSKLLNNKKKNGIISIIVQKASKEDKENITQNQHYTKMSEELLVATDDWDEERIIGEEMKNNSKEIQNNNNKAEIKLADWDWNEDELVNAELKGASHAELDMNDEKLLLIKEKSSHNDQEQDLIVPLHEKALAEKFNISNDDKYNILRKKHQTKVRATVSNLNIEHSRPAFKLQIPHYKVTLKREEFRNFHRSHFGSKIRPGTNIVFSKLKVRKRKRDKGKDVKDSFASTCDLTVGDTAPIYLMEYSEENPLALSKFGMANKLINYYRKTNEQDTTRPKLPVGETHVLGVQDKSPFWNFGFVEPGHIVPTLYNNMVRAPVFKHDVAGGDFLLVRSSGCGSSNRFFLRNINHLFTVGQTFPVVEIPGPNSRKVTSMRMTRLRMIVYRILNRTPTRAISLDPIAKHFPDQDYNQSRQKVKEFMKYQRDGPDKGLWKLKDNEPLLNNENTRKLITPEQIAEVEAMNYGITYKEDNEIFNIDDRLVKFEESLLPWNVSRNFINATQMRSMIQVNSNGDPTGCGEGLSFLKASMKGGFTKSLSKADLRSGASSTSLGSTGHTTQQQKLYAEEISRRWYISAKSLSITNPFEEMNDPNETNPSNKSVKAQREDGKLLRIVRKKRDENGIIQRQTVVIKDPRVIKGYLKAKELRSQAKLDVNSLLSEDVLNVNNLEDIEMQKKILQNELVNLEKSQQRRVKRQTKEKEEIGPDGEVVKKIRRRRCATCGQLGHIRTNKSCPMYKGTDFTEGSAQPNSKVGTPTI